MDGVLNPNYPLGGQKAIQVPHFFVPGTNILSVLKMLSIKTYFSRMPYTAQMIKKPSNI